MQVGQTATCKKAQRKATLDLACTLTPLAGISRPSMDTLHACIIKQYIYNIIQYNTYKTSYNAIHIQCHTNNTTTIKNTKLWFNETCYRKLMIATISSKHAHAHALLKNIVCRWQLHFLAGIIGRSEPTL